MTDPLLQQILLKFDSLLEDANRERQKDDLPLVGKVELFVLGQFSLFADPRAREFLPLVATRDFDATIKGDWSARTLLKIALEEFNLEYDDLSDEIWIPEDHEFMPLFENDRLSVKYLSPIDSLTSKAVKALDKNKFLIKQAILVYPELKAKLRAYGVEID